MKANTNMPRIAIIYFSATNVTRSYAKVIHRHLNLNHADAHLFDITPYIARQSHLPVNQYDFFIFGFPVFADFSPLVIHDWIPTIEGMGKKCTQFFTYGARSSGHAHYHTAKILTEANFRVMLSAEFLGRHTFNIAGWTAIPDRPNNTDFALAQQFADLSLSAFLNKEAPEYTPPQLDGYDESFQRLQSRLPKTERAYTNPTRVKENCRMCRLCETQCPTLAFNADTGLSNPATCIECMHCVCICPDNAIQADARMKDVYPEFLKRYHLTDEIMAAKQGLIFQPENS
jgi:NAD-dependent dihydropyrimidine dehydrogenase PreA subunit/flavodoxin